MHWGGLWHPWGKVRGIIRWIQSEKNMIRNENWWSGRGLGGGSAGIERKSPSLKVIRSQLLLVLVTLVSAFRRVIWYQGVGTYKARELHQTAYQPSLSVFVLPGDGLWLSICCFSLSKASSRVARKARALVLSILAHSPACELAQLVSTSWVAFLYVCLPGTRPHTTPSGKRSVNSPNKLREKVKPTAYPIRNILRGPCRVPPPRKDSVRRNIPCSLSTSPCQADKKRPQVLWGSHMWVGLISHPITLWISSVL